MQLPSRTLGSGEARIMFPPDTDTPSQRTAKDSAIAIKSALILGVSLIATWSVALAVRLYLPRHLGPEAFGVLHFSETFSATSFIVLGLGVELYIQKNIPVRPAHASDFFGGVVLLRLLMSAGVFAVMLGLLTIMMRPSWVQQIVLVFGVGQIAVSLNGSLAGLLYATRAVKGVAVINVASKVLWGAGIALAIRLRWGLVGLAGAFVAAELLRLMVLSVLVRKRVGLSFRVDPSAVRQVIVASLPIYVNQIAITVYGKVDVSMLTVLSNDAEVGYYSTASNLAGLALLVSPLVGWVLLPLLSRAAARSQTEMFSILRRAILGILLLVLPVALLMGLGADLWVPALFGRAFLPAIISLRMLSPLFVLSYVTIVSGAGLLMLDRAWTLAKVSLVGLAVNPVLNLLLVPPAMRMFGAGGAGAGAATALLLTEACVTVALLHAIGKEAFDKASAKTVVKALLACGVVVCVDQLLRPMGYPRIAIDAGLYVVLSFGLGAVKPRDLVGLLRLVRERHAQ